MTDFSFIGYGFKKETKTNLETENKMYTFFMNTKYLYKSTAYIQLSMFTTHACSAVCKVWTGTI